MLDVIARKISKREYLKLLAMLGNEYQDYISARILLNSGKIPQGTTLASTSIEKLFKPILIFFGRQFGNTHITTRLFQNFTYIDKKLYNNLDFTFLELIEKSYHTKIHRFY